jgi:hypothetical protein
MNLATITPWVTLCPWGRMNGYRASEVEQTPLTGRTRYRAWGIV